MAEKTIQWDKDADGIVTLDGPAVVGDLITARVTDSDGIDLIAEAK